MKIIYIIIITYILIGPSAAISYAAMDNDVASDSDTVLNTIVQERIKAKKEYIEYKHQEEVKQKQAARDRILATRPIQKKKVADTSERKDIIIGAVLIAIALILTAYLHVSSKQKKVS